jgi:hypothetical protein
MKHSKVVSNGLHLVKAEDPSAASQQEKDTLIAQGVLRYQELQAEVDRALFASPQDEETLAVVMPQMQALRERLAAHGVRVH